MKETQLERILGLPSRLVVAYTVPTLIREFDFFNFLNKHPGLTLKQIASGLGNLNERVLDATLGYLDKEGFIEQTGQKTNPIYQLTGETRDMLTTDGSYDLSPFATILDDVVPARIPQAIIYALKTGNSASWKEVGDNWEQSMRSGAVAKNFSEGLMSRAKLLQDALVDKLKEQLVDSRRLLDIGGSLGDYSGAFVKANPKLNCTVYDLPAVVVHAVKNITEKKYDRVNTIPGDMFREELPAGFDTHFYSNVIHDWTPEQVRELLKKSHKALEKSGRVMVHDMHLSSRKNEPSFAVDHSLYLAIFTQGRCYSGFEIAQAMGEVGFTNIQEVNTVGGYSVITGDKK